MHLAELNLFNFRNYESTSVSFTPAMNCIAGPNGSGKTNLLDAIYYLSLTKSAFNTDPQCIKHQQGAFTVKGVFKSGDEEHEIRCGFQSGKKKVVVYNGSEYEKLTEHIGKFPVVMIAPNDTDIIREYSDARRKFFDGILCQVDSDYLEDLLTYSKVLRQRNSHLKMAPHVGALDKTLLETYDHSLIDSGKRIFEKREAFAQKFLPVLYQHYEKVSGGKEGVELQYESQLHDDDFVEKFHDNLSKDHLTKRTGFGVHKDDFIFSIDGHLLKRFGSQGQQKSFLIALKLAQYSLMKELKKFKPILLLDDIFDKLDEDRMSMLVQLVSSNEFGQIFVTDARLERTTKLLEQNNVGANVMQVSNANITNSHG